MHQHMVGPTPLDGQSLDLKYGAATGASL